MRTLCLLLLAASASAAEHATLVHATGDVTVEAAGAGRLAKAGASVPDGGSVATAAGATAILELPDGSRLKLRESSRLKLSLPKTRSPQTEVTLSLGSVFAKVMKRLPGAEFRVRAGTAVAAVRGTEFFTAFGRKAKKGKGDDLWVCVGKGVVDVSAGGKSRPVKEGEGVLIPGGKEVTKPKFYPWTKELNWNMDAAQGEVADKTKLDSAYTDPLDEDYR
jgi:ferric-dicitrate binding protein FerR (iron transport regulator)